MCHFNDLSRVSSLGGNRTPQTALKTALVYVDNTTKSTTTRASERLVSPPTGYFQNPRIFNRCGDFWFQGLLRKNRKLKTDPTYKGKPLFGLDRMTRNGEVGSTDPVLFWHTGGIRSPWG